MSYSSLRYYDIYQYVKIYCHIANLNTQKPLSKRHHASTEILEFNLTCYYEHLHTTAHYGMLSILHKMPFHHTELYEHYYTCDYTTTQYNTKDTHVQVNR